MVTTALPTQVRSARRREALLRAAIELLAEGGAKAVTHRAVAARAGVPAATTTYYFESIQALTEEALRRHVAERVQELAEMGTVAIAGGTTVVEVAHRFAEALAARSSEMAIAQYEVYLEAARNPALRESVRAALESFQTLAEQSLAALGAREPRALAHALVALIDGFMLHRLTRQGDHDPEELFEAMRALLVTQFVDRQTAEHLLGQLEAPVAGLPTISGG